MIQEMKVVIVGTRPFLFHKLPIEGFGDKRKTKRGSAGNDPEEWKTTYRADKDGKLFMPPEMIFGCMREAAKHTRRGRGSIIKYVAATLQVLDPVIYFDRSMPESDPETNDYEASVYLDVRGVRNPSTRGANIRYRVALSPGWKAKFEISYDDTIVGENEMATVLRDAGMLVGLGDGRSIGMGRFKVEKLNGKKIAV